MATFHENLKQSFKNFKNKYIGNVPSGVTLAQINADLTAKGNVRNNNGVLEYWDGTTWVEYPMPSSVPLLDYANPITITNGSAITEDGYILGSIGGYGDSSGTAAYLDINGKRVFTVRASYNSYNSNTVPILAVKKNDIIAGTVANVKLYLER